MVKIVSDTGREISDIVNFGCIVGVISLFGVVANVINMIVFYKQGFNSTMSISFFGMAISDLCGLLCGLWTGICFNPLFAKSDVPAVTMELQYLTAAVPHSGFARITGWITVFVTAERCLCIIYPLSIKQIVTPLKTTVIVCAIYIIIAATFLPEYITIYMDWKFYPEKNRSLIALTFTEARQSVESLVYILYSIFGSASFIAVIVFTALLVIQLKQKSKWRKCANLQKESSDTISTRDRKTMNMVVMIATILIVCYMPGASVSMVTFFEKEFSITGEYFNILMVAWSLVYVFEAFNSSVNIFLYYNMSSKYRETFHQIFKTGNN